MIVRAPCDEYTPQSVADVRKIARHIDQTLASHFTGQKIVLRAVSSTEHTISQSELLKRIEQLGTDRYDAARDGDRYKNAQGKHIDFFGRTCTVGQGKTMSLPLLEGFHIYGPKYHNKPAVRMDIWLVYNRAAVRAVAHSYVAAGQVKRDGFVFRSPDHKSDALLGVIVL